MIKIGADIWWKGLIWGKTEVIAMASEARIESNDTTKEVKSLLVMMRKQAVEKAQIYIT